MNPQFACLLVMLSLLCYSTAGSEIEDCADDQNYSTPSILPSSVTAIRTYTYGSSTTQWTPIVTTAHPTCPECTDTRMPSVTETLSSTPGGHYSGSSYYSKPTSVSVTLPLVSGTKTIWSQTPSSSSPIIGHSTTTLMASSSSLSSTTISTSIGRTSSGKPSSPSTSVATPTTSQPASAGHASDATGIMTMMYAVAGLCIVGGYMFAM